MAAGLKINLGVLDDVANSCKEDGEVSDCAEYAQNKINKIQNKVLLMRGKTYKEFHNLLDDLEEELRGLKNNIENVSDDIAKYIDKMDDATPTNYDSEIFISSDFDRIKTMSKNLEDDFQSYTTNLVNSKLMESPPSISVEDLKDDNSESHKKKLEVYNKYTELLSNLAEGFLCDTYIDEVTEQNKSILDFYDQDYDMSDHLKDIGVVAVKIALGVAVGAVCTVAAEALAIGTAAIVIEIAIESGVSLVVNLAITGVADYRSGESFGESLSDGLDKGVSSAFGTALTGGISNQIEIKGLSGMNLDEEIKRITSRSNFNPITVVNGKEIVTDNKMLDAINASGKEFSIENLVKSSVTTPAGNEIGDGVYQADMSEILTNYPDETETGVMITYSFDEEGEVEVESIEQYDIG